MLHTLNIDSLNIGYGGEASHVLPQYVWIDALGRMTNLCEPARFSVLREGIDGFSNSTADYAMEQTPNLMSEVLRQTNVRQREFGFRVVIVGENHADLEEKRRELLDVFSHRLGTGMLVKTFDNGMSVRIKCNISSGYPSIPDGLPPRYQARSQVVEIRFIAPDPYFYGVEQTVLGDANGNVTVLNLGDTATPCVVTVKGEACKNTTTGMTMKNKDGKSIDGLTVSVDDRRITAVDDNGENRLANFAYDSQFWMLEQGENVLEGVAGIRFAPRWSGI